MICSFADARHAAFHGDLSSENALRALHADVLRELGPIDVLFVNHGDTGTQLGRHGAIQDIEMAEFERIWRANTAPAFLVRRFIAPGI
jgi:3-oxoacyl-[acyl-carrier protein] reductase